MRFSVALLVTLLLLPVPPSLFVEAMDTASGSQIQQIAACLSRVQGNCPTRMSCQTLNPGAMTYRPWQQRFGGRPCGRANNTTCFERVENGIAAMITLIRMRMNQNQVCRTIFGLLKDCQYTETNHELYARHVGRVMGGVAPNQTLDPTNGVTMACLVAGMAHWEAGQSGVPFNMQQLLDGIAIAYGQREIPLGDPNFQSQFFQSNQVDLSEYLRRSTPVYPNSPNYIPPNPARPGVNHDVYSAPTYTTPPSSATSSQASSAQAVVQDSAAMILLQPKKVQAGQTSLISWTSVNMRSSSCTVKKDGSDFSSGNEGAQKDTVHAESTYVLTCTRPEGGNVESSATITIE